MNANIKSNKNLFINVHLRSSVDNIPFSFLYRYKKENKYDKPF